MFSCVIINFNSEKLLKTCLASVQALRGKKEVVFLDNASSDGSVAFVQKHFPDVRLVLNTVNSGYAGAANQAVSVSRGEYILILNPDIVFEPEYAEILLRHMERDSKIGAIIGKLRKYDFAAGKKTDVIDSAGLVMYRSRRCVDRGQGEEDRGQYDEAGEVFGVTGACPLYRRSALEDCRIGGNAGNGGEIFDNDFFMYKEDVDISWRMGMFGWKSFYEPAALAYHGRGTGAVKRSSLLRVAAGRAGLSKFQKYYSYKNEHLMRVKNEKWSGFFRNFFPILFKEFLMFGWMTVREPYLWKAFFHFLWQFPRALKKRREIMKRL